MWSHSNEQNRKRALSPGADSIVPGERTEVLVGGLVSGEGCGQKTGWVEQGVTYREAKEDVATPRSAGTQWKRDLSRS